MNPIILVLIYLSAIVAANLSVTHFGPAASYINAFLFIGLDLTSRDRLHDIWKKNLVQNMTWLILVGSVLSYVLNRSAGIIAIASFVAFACASIVDGVTYHYLSGKNKLIQVNGSNIFGAIVDSIIFPTIAFGGLNIVITLGQFIAKVCGGFVWSLVLRGRREYPTLYSDPHINKR